MKKIPIVTVVLLFILITRSFILACIPSEKNCHYSSKISNSNKFCFSNSQLKDPVVSSPWSHLISVEFCDYNSECQPWLAEESNKLFFVAIDANSGPPRQGHIGIWDIYESKWDSINNQWGEPVNLGPNVNTTDSERAPCTTPDGDTLFFARNGKIYISVKEGNNWSLAQPLPSPVNTGHGDNDPAISFDHKRLYFSSHRMKTGDADIYIAQRGSSVFDWYSVENIGAPVNSPYDERKPFETADRTRLYFTDFPSDGSTIRPHGYGGTDLWVSTWTGSSWSEPVNAGPPLNNDLTLCSAYLKSDFSQIYTGSESFEGSRGEEDIWMAYWDSLKSPASVSDNSVHWQMLGDLEGAWNVYCLAEDSKGTIYAGTSSALYPGAGLRGMVYRSEDKGLNWTPAEPLSGMIVYSLLVSREGVLYAGTYPHGDVFRSTNRGISWNKTAKLPGATAVRVLIETKDGRILAGTSPTIDDKGRIYATSNEGQSWTLLGPLHDLTNGVFSIFEAQDSTLYAGGWSNPRKIYKSIDGGSSWTVLDNFPFPPNVEICAHDITQTSDGTIWITGWIHAYHGYIFKSTDSGASWDTTGTIKIDKLYSVSIYTLLEDPKGNLLIGLQPGPDKVVLYSDDGGNTWQNTGILSGAHEALCLLKASDGSIYAGTTPNGDVFRYIPFTGIKDNTPCTLSDFTLYQNFPNPFNSSTTINYQMSKDSKISIIIYDMLGQEIRTLVNESQSAGYYSMIWDGKDNLGNSVSSGIYFYQLKNKYFVQIKKSIFLK